jgi:hypothetical protein
MKKQKKRRTLKEQLPVSGILIRRVECFVNEKAVFVFPALTALLPGRRRINFSRAGRSSSRAGSGGRVVLYSG